MSVLKISRKPATEAAHAGLDIGFESSSLLTDFNLILKVRH